MKVKDKVVVVTGAGNGIGRELALRLLSKGASVAGVDVNPANLDETAELAGGFEKRFAGFLVDVTDRAAVEAFQEEAVARFGGVDGLINNAGIIHSFTRLNELDYPAIERVLQVNLFGTLYMTKAFLPHFLTRSEAHIANLSSMGGFVPVPGQTMYCAAKAGVKLMSEGLASELLGTAVRVTIVFPGAIATNITANSGVEMRMAPVANTSAKGNMMALSPAKAAKIIVNGMERNARRLFVGKDSALLDKLNRLSPRLTSCLMAKMMGALLAN